MARPPVDPSSTPSGTRPASKPGGRRGHQLARATPLRRRLLRLYDALHRHFGPQGRWPARSASEIVGAILTQSRARVNVERAMSRLRGAGALEAAALGRRPAGRPGTLVEAAGTGRLRRFVEHLARHHGGRLRRLLRRPAPALRAEILAIPGIGPETADSILLHAAGRPVFVADAHARRILSRHRIVAPGADHDALQAVLMDNLPRDPGLFDEYHALLVRVAGEYCRTRPHCDGCPLRPDLRGRPPLVSRSDVPPRRRVTGRTGRRAGSAEA